MNSVRRSLEVGKDVKNVQPGDRISVMPLASCGQCYYCARGMRHLCVKMGCVGLSWDGGGMAEYTVINDYHANKLPDTVSDKQGALIEPAAVALYAVDRGGVTVGSSVLITGAGPIGVLAALACHAAGASEDLRERAQFGARRQDGRLRCRDAKSSIRPTASCRRRSAI